MSSAGTQPDWMPESSELARAKLRVLLVEDDPVDAELVLHGLRSGGFDVSVDVVQTPEQFRARVQETLPDIVLADYNLGRWRGMEALEILRAEGRDVPLILVSGALGDINAVECIKQGATDYVLKDSLTRLAESVRRALREKKLREESKRAEEKLAAKVAELARSNAELEQFAYVASHDLQEPLRMVANYTQLLAERYRGKLDEQAERYINYAVDGATRMQAMIQDLLTLSRAGRHGKDVHSIDSNQLVEQAMKNLQAAIRESGAVVKYDRLPMIRANGIQITQLFQNLIANAIKFQGAETPVVQISAVAKNGEWIFSVADNGIGIAAEHSEVIFVVFQRLHTRTEYPGNGIGLSICKKIVERHGGRIWLDSKEGHGCTFKFTLPAGVNRDAEAEEKSEKAEEHDAIHV
jgi:signal transduction histidine kinase